jgi:hypothetical protein
VVIRTGESLHGVRQRVDAHLQENVAEGAAAAEKAAEAEAEKKQKKEKTKKTRY